MVDYKRMPTLTLDQIDMVDFYNKSEHRDKQVCFDPYYTRILKDVYAVKGVDTIQTMAFGFNSFADEVLNQPTTTSLLKSAGDKCFEYIMGAVELVIEAYLEYSKIESECRYYEYWKAHGNKMM